MARIQSRVVVRPGLSCMFETLAHQITAASLRVIRNASRSWIGSANCDHTSANRRQIPGNVRRNAEQRLATGPAVHHTLLSSSLSFALLNLHIFEFAGFEYVATFLALYVFDILVTRDDLDLRVLAKFAADFLLERLRGRDRHHLHREVFGLRRVGCRFVEIGRILGWVGVRCQDPKVTAPSIIFPTNACSVGRRPSCHPKSIELWPVNR